MQSLKRHKNITLKRIALDIYQYFRTFSSVTRLWGRPFARSHKYIELDITYRCNLRCNNCNRSCTQAPSKAKLSVGQIQQFISDTLEKEYQWERIRLLGGEPTLHADFFKIISILLAYKEKYNPELRLVVCTNGHGRKVNAVLSKLPEEVIQKNTLKTSNSNLFRPFNVAPIDSCVHKFFDFSSGCRIIEDCGMGYTPQGYYICAVAGAMDRIFGFNIGRQTLPEKNDTLIDHCRTFCPLCGHFGFIWPTKKQKISPTWQKAYEKYKKHNRQHPPHNHPNT